MRVAKNVEPRPGEMSLKAWAIGEAQRLGLKDQFSVYARIRRGKYPRLVRRYESKRTVFVAPLLVS